YDASRDLYLFPTRRSSDLIFCLFFASVNSRKASAPFANSPQLRLGRQNGRARSISAASGASARAVTTSASTPVICSARLGCTVRSEEHTSELQSRENLVCR